jgi:hypothetical protein
VAEKKKISQEMWITKPQFSPYKVQFIPFVMKPLKIGFTLGKELDWVLQQLSDQGGDLGAL